jgi:outer membrane immunogenic protein
MKRYLLPIVRISTAIYLIAGLSTNALGDGGVPYACPKPKAKKMRHHAPCPTRHHAKVHCPPTHVDPCCGDAVCCFTGLYAGGQIGLGMTRNVNTFIVNPNNEVGRNPHSTRGVIGGLHLGYGYQWPSDVYAGLEIFGNLSHNKSKSLSGDGSTQRDRRYNNFGAAARLGYIWQCTLLYARLGVESTKWGHTEAVDDLNFSVHTNKRKVGFVPGVGIAQMITDHLIAGLEGTWGFYKKSNLNAVPAVPIVPGVTQDNKYSNRSYDITFRLSYKW